MTPADTEAVRTLPSGQVVALDVVTPEDNVRLVWLDGMAVGCLGRLGTEWAAWAPSVRPEEGPDVPMLVTDPDPVVMALLVVAHPF